jgi:hypothetical protein
MPYKTEKIALESRALKRSAKLLECQKEMVLNCRDRGFSFNRIAKIFHCSKRLIQFICDPQKQKENYKRRQEKGGSTIYYDKEKHTIAIKNLRNYKQKLFKSTKT